MSSTAREQAALTQGLLAHLQQRRGQWLSLVPLIAATGQASALVLAALDALVHAGHVHHARRRSEELWGVGVEGSAPDVNSQHGPTGQEGNTP